jgi:hypothetical protein
MDYKNAKNAPEPLIAQILANNTQEGQYFSSNNRGAVVFKVASDRFAL